MNAVCILISSSRYDLKAQAESSTLLYWYMNDSCDVEEGIE